MTAYAWLWRMIQQKYPLEVTYHHFVVRIDLRHFVLFCKLQVLHIERFCSLKKKKKEEDHVVCSSKEHLCGQR